LTDTFEYEGYIIRHDNMEKEGHASFDQELVRAWINPCPSPRWTAATFCDCDQIREYTDATINGALSAVDYNIIGVHALHMLVPYVIKIGAKIREMRLCMMITT
jgi:hypothetical protein